MSGQKKSVSRDLVELSCLRSIRARLLVSLHASNHLTDRMDIAQEIGLIDSMIDDLTDCMDIAQEIGLIDSMIAFYKQMIQRAA